MSLVNGREWFTPTFMAEHIAKNIGTNERLPTAVRERIASNREVFVKAVAEAIFDSDLRYELTLLRLVEKIKDSIGLLAFGALAIPNSVDQKGQPILTPVGEIHSLLRDIYTPEFLDMFDEEGNPLLEPPADT